MWWTAHAPDIECHRVLLSAFLQRKMTRMAQSGHSRHRNNLSVIGLTADIGPGSPASMTLGNMRANGVRTLAAWCLKHDFDGPEG